jgi:hypothetical protein
MNALAQLTRRAALLAHADAEAAEASRMLDRGLTERAAEHAEEALHARLAALSIEQEAA